MNNILHIQSIDYVDLRRIFNYNRKKSLLNSIIIKLSSLDLRRDFDKIKVLKKELTDLEVFINFVDQIYKNLVDLHSLLKIVDNDVTLVKEIQNQLIVEEHNVSKLEFSQMFLGKHDKYNCYVDIQSGSGGIEAQDWANMLLRMYLRWMNSKGFITKISEESLGEISGIKSVTIQVIGDYSYGWLRTESGIHRLVRKSPFDSGGKRHTSFASVFVYPDIGEKIDVCIKPEDIRIDVYRASGAGGQHVNRTESAVRVTHIPTNIVTQCQSGRSQHKNKNQAMQQLKAKLYNLELQKKHFEKKMIENKKQNITWGNQIRSYILDNSRIKDLRTGIEKRNIKAILDGNLDDFVRASVRKYPE